MKLTVNGRDGHVEADIRTSLLDLLRDHLGLTGTIEGIADPDGSLHPMQQAFIDQSGRGATKLL